MFFTFLQGKSAFLSQCPSISQVSHQSLAHIYRSIAYVSMSSILFWSMQGWFRHAGGTARKRDSEQVPNAGLYLPLMANYQTFLVSYRYIITFINCWLLQTLRCLLEFLCCSHTFALSSWSFPVPNTQPFQFGIRNSAETRSFLHDHSHRYLVGILQEWTLVNHRHVRHLSIFQRLV